MYEAYGADTFRLYQMSTGPMDASRPWNTRDVIGMQRFLQRVWRNVVEEDSGNTVVADVDPSDDLRRTLHRTIADVQEDFASLRFNTAVSKLIELNNALTSEVGTEADRQSPREVVEAMALMLAPLAPHIAEEIWSRLGHESTLAFETFPALDEAMLVEDTVEYPIQINGKVRSKIMVAADASSDAIEAAARADERVVEFLDGNDPKKVIVVPGRLVNIVA